MSRNPPDISFSHNFILFFKNFFHNIARDTSVPPQVKIQV